ncbi:MAG: biliverdin-producing heme oxygenase [Bacteroidota bacterium]
MQQQLASETPRSQKGDIFFNQLKEDTASMHRALEQLPLSVAITSPEITTTGYRNYLLRMLPVVQDLEKNIFPLLANTIPDLEERRKLPLLLDDLHYLDEEFENTAILPLSAAHENMSTAFAMGIMYVLEGSTLGGRFIGNNVQKALGYTPETGARYFGGYGGATGSMWKNFLQQLGKAEAAEGAGEEIINGARFAFTKIYNQFKG